MVWKCPRCKFTSRTYTVMQRHFYNKHHVSSAKKAVNKGKDTKKHVFKPTIHKRK